MTYSQTLEWMFAQLPMYQHQGKTAFKKDLTNTLFLAEYLDHPERKFKSIHIAGTNGKGSVSHILASVLQQAGYKVGLYTSPHLKDFRERIKINGKMASEEFVITFIEEHNLFLQKTQLSFFEMTVGMAFKYFAQEKVDIAIIETGLGGRLDSTNIILPELSIITNISLDHMSMLGDNLHAIAQEKEGIIKSATTVVIGESNEKTSEVFIKKSKEKGAPLFFAEEEVYPSYASDLKGLYQVKNKQTVLCALNRLKKMGWQISSKDISAGFKQVIKNTGLLGRWQQLGLYPKIICDTGHNPEGLRYVFKQLKQEEYNALHFVLGVVNDKDLESILPMFPKNAKYYFCAAAVPRALNAKTLADKASEFGLNGEIYLSVTQAFQTAKDKAEPKDLIFIGGSTFTVAEIL